MQPLKHRESNPPYQIRLLTEITHDMGEYIYIYIYIYISLVIVVCCSWTHSMWVPSAQEEHGCGAGVFFPWVEVRRVCG